MLASALAITATVGFGVVRDRDDHPQRVEAVPTSDRSDGRPETTGSPQSPAPTTPVEVTTTTTASRLGSGKPVTIAFAGDVHFEGIVREQLDRRGDAMLDDIAPILGRADLTVVNLETAITEAGAPVPKAYTFRAPPRALIALRAAGVDVVSMANNHGLDYGDSGFDDSLAAEQATGLPIIGIGRDDREAYAPHRVRVRGQRIAVIAATQVLDDAFIGDWTATRDHRGLASAKEVDRLVAAVRAARARADTVVVFLHWGTERQTCPQDRQTSLARTLVDAGADIIVGGHAHRLQGAGRLGEAFVAYGLGNFVFYTQSGPGTSSGVLEVTVTGRRVDGYRWAPAQLRGGVPVPLTGDEATAAHAEWQALRDCTDLRR
jgi:poly-gamma-glutamate synthesis protein (capsule biosynthesis protein)